MATKITITVDFGSPENEQMIDKKGKVDEVVWQDQRGRLLIPIISPGTIIFPGKQASLRVDRFDRDPDGIVLGVSS